MTKNNQITKKDTTEQIKQKIITRFNRKVRGRVADISMSNSGHDGKHGHWLEVQMGVSHNARNAPDLWGFEMKNSTRGKTTFGDWSADYYIFNNTEYFFKDRAIINRDKFMIIFGAPNHKLKNRYSWSGKPAPKIGACNEFGQRLVVDQSNNILALYSFSKDHRLEKKSVVPIKMQKEDLVLAKWSVENITKKVEDKFNKLGWFKCEKDKKTGKYTKIVFGNPINFKSWISGVKSGLIYFDTGMHVGNSRYYSSWRANNKYWDSLVTSTY